MNDILEIQKPGNFKTQSSHCCNKTPKELLSGNMECLTLPYKNFR